MLQAPLYKEGMAEILLSCVAHSVFHSGTGVIQ